MRSKIIKSAAAKRIPPIKGTQKVMLRDFIHDRLYHEEGGYFQRSEHQVGVLSEAI